MDSAPKIALRLMNGGGLYPREVTHHPLSAVGVTQIIQENEREVEVRSEVDANETGEGLVVGTFRQSQWSVVLEPFVEDVTVNPPVNSNYHGAVNIPKNALVFLRPNDSITFAHQGLTVHIVEEGQKQSSRPTSEDEVQVKSSNVEPEPIPTDEDVETDPSEDEDDLDRSSNARSQRTPNEVTPATSKPTEKIENVDTIKETPSRAAFTNSTGDDQPYSTAPGTLLDNHEVVGDANSPSVQAQQRSHGESQARAGDSLINTFENTLSDQLDIDESDEKGSTPLPKKLVTYSRAKSGRGKPRGSTRQDRGPGIVADAQPESNFYDDEDEKEGESDDELTSDPLGVHEITTTAAIRTMGAGSLKRKSPHDDVEGEQESTETVKKQKKDKDFTTFEMAGDHEGDPEPDDMPEEDPKSKQKPRKKSRLPKVPRKTLRTLQAMQEPGEEIAVAGQTSSPEVVIKSRLRSETPSSSAPSTALTGKVPKLLLSSDCKAQNKPAVKQLLREAGAMVVEKVPSRRTHFVCIVPKQHSLRSAKVLLSLVRSKLIVTEEWLVKSAEAGELLDPAEFVHENLEESITHDRRRVFIGKHLFFTHDAVANYKDGWIDIQEVAKEAGASEVDKVAFNRPSYLGNRDDVVFFGVAKGDKNVSELINDHGRTVYTKDLFTDSIISGALELNSDDHKLSATVPAKKGRRS